MALISLRNSHTFPRASPTIPDLMIQATLQPHQRRCFAGQMLRIGSSVHYNTEILVINQEDTVFRVGFAFPSSGTNGRGDIPAKYLKRGCTILIQDAVSHDMPEWGEGFEIRDPRLVKILPFGLSDLVHLRERLTEYQSIVGTQRLCYGCQKRQPVTHRCPRCKMFYFCNRECQQIGIHSGNHGWDCAVLRDPDMIALFTRRGHELEFFESVSLQPQDGVSREMF